MTNHEFCENINTTRMSDLKAFIKTQLQELLNEPKMGFEGNELAFLSSQCKNEMQIRDKIAWRLHTLCVASGPRKKLVEKKLI